MTEALAFPFIGMALEGAGRLHRITRGVLFGGFALAVISAATFTAFYGLDVEYRLEVALISIDWTVLILAGFLLAMLFNRAPLRHWRHD